MAKCAITHLAILFPFLLIQLIKLETVIECPVCGNKQFKPFLTCKDYLVSGQGFNIQSCTSCDFRFTNPRPDANSIVSYYQSENYISHNDESHGLINTAYRLVRNYTLQSKLKLIDKLNGKVGRLLDVGCGTGAFLESCQKGGWTVRGIEPDEKARSIARKKLTAELKPDLNALAGAEPFDIITLWHVLEHIADLNKVIPQLCALLKSSGTLLIAVPNSNSYDAVYFQEYWAAYDVPRHLHHFTPPTIQLLFKQHGFSLINTKPMIFDAFYIALLSSRYQTGKTDYLKSIRIGIASNAEAKRTGNSSSLIYIFQKI